MPSYRRMLLQLRNLVSPAPAQPPYHHVCQVGDPVLRTEALPVPEEDLCAPHIHMIIEHMKRILKDYKLVGLSACQVGIPLRIMAVHIPKSIKEKVIKKNPNEPPFQEIPLTVLLNPSLLVTDNSTLLREESCASVKGYSAVVPRYAAVTVKGYSEGGRPVSVSGTGFAARVLQHEVDHMAGTLYLDTMHTRTFSNDGWQTINNMAGQMYIHFKPEK